jgi:hypothetical protein
MREKKLVWVETKCNKLARTCVCARESIREKITNLDYVEKFALEGGNFFPSPRIASLPYTFFQLAQKNLLALNCIIFLRSGKKSIMFRQLVVSCISPILFFLHSFGVCVMLEHSFSVHTLSFLRQLKVMFMCVHD